VNWNKLITQEKKKWGGKQKSPIANESTTVFKPGPLPVLPKKWEGTTLVVAGGITEVSFIMVYT